MGIFHVEIVYQVGVCVVWVSLLCEELSVINGFELYLFTEVSPL